jgi:cytochrome c biogenesis protein CcdA
MNGVLARFMPHGLRGQFLLGALLGVAWVPCSGPTLGAAVTLAADSNTVSKAALVMLAFAMGACVPLLALAYGSRHALKARRSVLATFGRIANPALGGVLAVVGILVLSGLDRSFEAALVSRMPDWLLAITTRY